MNRLTECDTTVDRDTIVREIKEDVAAIIDARPALLTHWLLRLDGINRRCIGQGR